MKTKEELEQIKEEYTKLNKKLSGLSEDELKQISGGTNTDEDRASIQKEIDQSIAQINDNALL